MRSRLALLLAPVLVATLAVAPVRAQQPVTGGPPAPTANAPASTAAARPAYRTIAQRFDAANVTHDGRLTPEQARAGMPAIYRHFAEIDTGHKGYLTLDQVRSYSVEWRRAHPDGVETSSAK